MKLALSELDYKNIYHFFEIPSHPTHTKLWVEALKNKYEGSPSEAHKMNWGEILGDYDVSLFYP